MKRALLVCVCLATLAAVITTIVRVASPAEHPAIAAAKRYFVETNQPTDGYLFEMLRYRPGPRDGRPGKYDVALTRDGRGGVAYISVEEASWAVFDNKPGRPRGFDASRPNVIQTREQAYERMAELHAWQETNPKEKWDVRWFRWPPPYDGGIASDLNNPAVGARCIGARQLVELEGLPVSQFMSCRTGIELDLNTGVITIWTGHGGYRIQSREWRISPQEAMRIAEKARFMESRYEEHRGREDRGPASAAVKGWVAYDQLSRPARLTAGYIVHFREFETLVEVDGDTGAVLQIIDGPPREGSNQ